jgi:ParB family transcriptional regulator, chromosome partitioning protein
MIEKVSVSLIRPNPFQARRSLDEDGIRGLVAEIKENGLFVGALRGRRRADCVELCSGHRRVEAIRRIGWPTVEIDLSDLSDEQMVDQALIENLQREGLNDLDKAEGLANAVKLRCDRGLTSVQAIAEVAQKTGLGIEWMRAILGLIEFEAPAKDLIRQGQIRASTAISAQRLGGAEMIATAVDKGLAQHRIDKLAKELATIKDDQVRAKVKRAVVGGDLLEPEQIRDKARTLIAQKNAKQRGRPDLTEYIVRWTVWVRSWNELLDQALPHKDYIDHHPQIAAEFREAIRELISRLGQFV